MFPLSGASKGKKYLSLFVRGDGTEQMQMQIFLVRVQQYEWLVLFVVSSSSFSYATATATKYILRNTERKE
jgi:hypothetical protein